MHSLLLHHYPAACSRIVMVALEELGVDFEDRGVALLRGENRQAAFLALNPRGQVPVLVVDDVPITETAAILHYLARAYPGAKLLPVTGNEARDTRCLTDLAWCSGALHPMSHRIFRPGFYTQSEPDGVKAVALSRFAAIAREIDDRLKRGVWWYGDDWSIVDTYLCWIYSAAADHGFDVQAYPAMVDHRLRVEARPAFQRALQRERTAVVRDGLAATA